MKICLFGVSGIALGKHNIKDPRLDQADKLVEAQDVSRGDTRAGSADVERFGQLNELRSRSVRTPDEHRYLQSDPGRPTRLLVIQVLPFPDDFAFHPVAP